MSEVIDPAAMTLVSTTAVETVAAWAAGTTYAIGDKARLDSTKAIYQSAQASNTGKNPATSPTAWIKIGPTNAQAVFDDSYRTQSTRAGSLTYVISTAAFTDRVALLNLTGNSAHVVATKDGVEVYNRTFSLMDDKAIADRWSYYYEPYVYISDLVVDDIPTTSGMTYTITVSGPAAVGIGLIRIGRGKFIGKAVMGSGVGTKRYSLPNFDEYGNYTPIMRRNAKRGTFDMFISADRVDALKRYFDELDITPVVFVMAGKATRAIIWGFARSVDFTWFTYGIDKYRIETEGLT